jgi:hypothetical protein
MANFTRRLIPAVVSLAPPLRTALLSAAVLAGLAAGQRGLSMQAPFPLVVDATAPVAAPEPGSYPAGPYPAPGGRTMAVNSRYLVLDGRPWLPAMGELHYTRVPPESWEEEILKMKAGGIEIISTYVFWIHHEEVEGTYDWSGGRDLRRFVELCARHGMFVQLRIGPWDHGEARNGGFPDWLVKRVPERDLRTVSEPYISIVQGFYDEVARQVKGLLWKDGGPILGVQLENEYARRGPGAGEGYILKLKEMALRSGLDVPLYVVTGWDFAVVPKGAVLPVYGGYMDAPWDGSTGQLPPSEVYAFRFGSRVTGDMGMMGARARAPSGRPALPETPFLGAEFGGGMESTYHRRPVIAADDVAAMYPVMLGSGVNLYGTYMFHGGQNPEGRLSTLQESQATGYPNDVPVRSYDFDAPLGEYGQERESFRMAKVFNYFLEDFGDRLAPLPARAPEVLPSGPGDFSVPRLSVRTAGRSGFVFLNNYVRHYPMPTWERAQVVVKLPSETLTMPAQPVTVPSGAYFIWPFNFDLGVANLKYSTAQLFTRRESGGVPTFYFAAVPGIAPEFAFECGPGVGIEAGPARVAATGDLSRVSALSPGFDCSIVLRARSGAAVRITVLTMQEAMSSWKVSLSGSERLLLTKDAFYADESSIHLQSAGDPVFRFMVAPQLAGGLRGSLAIRPETAPGGASGFAASAEPAVLPFAVERISDAGAVPPTRLGPRASWRKNAVAMAPDDGAFGDAAAWRLTLPALPPGLDELFMEVRYAGDVARLESGGRLLDDNFFDGQAWQVGLRRFGGRLAPGSVELRILPLRSDAPIYLEDRSRAMLPQSPQAARLVSFELVPLYGLSISTAPEGR